VPGHALTATGRLLMPQHNGQVLVRHKAGVWTRLEAPTAFDLMTATELDDGRIAAAGEGGALWIWNALGERPASVSLGRFDQQVVALGHQASLGYYLAAYRSGRLVLLRSAAIEGPWQTIGEFTDAGVAGHYGALWARVYPTETGLIATLHPDRILILDAADGSWSEHHAPARLVDLSVVPGGGLALNIYDSKTRTHNLQFSADGAQSWSAIPEPGPHGPSAGFLGLDAQHWLAVIAAADQGNLFSGVSGDPRALRAALHKPREVKIVETVDGGHSWHDYASLKIAAGSGGTLQAGPSYWTLTDAFGAGLLMSTDSGKTWSPMDLPK